jgi:glyoxylase-like metal-dependent hydrolase (beta-lactamase superfamily II)
VARASDRLPDNVDGELFVDSSCIDCDLCRQIDPQTFGRAHGQSFVQRQPVDTHRALMALVTCPTSSIGTIHKHDSRAAARAFPELVADEVYFCGWASESSYGASSYLIRREGGNVLVDSPRASSTLMQRLDELGGVRFMVLTHRDDVADHAAYHARFGCDRVVHRADAVPAAEIVVDGDFQLAPDLRIVAVPGHTRGSIALLHGAFAFTGDHVWADDGALEAGRDVCWYSWPEQKRSIARLAEHAFTHILPGHGRPFRAESAGAMRSALLDLAAAM